jgi:hypothetical protein
MWVDAVSTGNFNFKAQVQNIDPGGTRPDALMAIAISQSRLTRITIAMSQQDAGATR